jgi:iron complex transport system permease protein
VTGSVATPAAATARAGQVVPGRRAFRLCGGRVSFLVRRRSVAVAGGLAVLTLLAAVASLSLGRENLAPVEVVRALAGTGRAVFVVNELRLPRVVVGLAVGAALGLSGALVQTVARNPLASPDFVGVTHGAGLAVVCGLVLAGAGPVTVPVLAVAGGVLTALLMYLLAWRHGLHPHRLVLVGVGVHYTASSAIAVLRAHADIGTATRLEVWLHGSLNGRGFGDVVPLLAVCAAVLPALAWAAWAMRAAGMDDVVATGLGVRAGRLRALLAGLGVLLAALAVGAGGAIDLVALVAPQVALRLTRAPAIPLVSTALCGALLVCLADLLARRALAPYELPVGVVTALLGAPYLLWLLARSRGGTA